jgi:purine catabolism regulator
VAGRQGETAPGAEFERRERERRSRIGVLIARGRYDDALAALSVCWPEQRLPPQLRALLARGTAERAAAFLEAFHGIEPNGFAFPATALGAPSKPGLADLVLLIGADSDDQLSPTIDLAREHLIDLAIGRATTTEQAPVGIASARARAVALGEPLLGGLKRDTLTLWADRGNPMIEMLASGGRTIGDEILGPLSERTQEALTLRRTLRAYLATGGRANQTVRELSIHRNTLRHRLGRIEQLTGCSLASADDRAELWMALRLVTDSDPRPVGDRTDSSEETEEV